MIEGSTWIYKSFLVREHPPGVVKAYRNPEYWDSEITSYETRSRADMEWVIDDAGDEGDFIESEHRELFHLP